MTSTVETAPASTAVRLHDPAVRGFASDNYSGVHPEVLAALAAANEGHQVSYGEDDYTARLQQLMEGYFGAGIECFPVFNGTGANVLSLQSLLPRWGAVVCASTAHINMDENGAPERIGGIKLLQVPTADGKLTPELIDKEAWGWGDEHRAQPLAVSITQTTELGTCYTPDEVRAIAEHVHSKGMKLHMDGARLANAAAHLNVPLRAFTRDAGVDILSFGGTKNGLLFGEVVIALNPAAAQGLIYLRKMNMQLASKMRFMSAQFIALLEGDLWLRSASHANAMAARLRAGVESIPGVELSQKTESNGVFAVLPPGVADRLRASFRFYDWNEAAGEVRWMCSFDTTEDDVDSFIAAIKRELAAG
ncbi:low specificity L-threonine aldolase [Arthrobacter sp. AL08]|uniref:threonine aldolase family protein n=1 Tax=Micrococcaceae TaxID=1268 RepID=UPI001CFF6CBD|nr:MULTISPECIES: low specificity L-threonine aldolase [Micrococcaceae]MCB5280854.1 Low specificity L-threonine aldolase [Arthrobacter sp. ES1]MDI3241588.1 low specificity L-threonine aldolase [Arthrobacter sp. AL05]MDI3277598.1 low specificity L-threonine aldolase [Arthrobacter sp. AL08]MDJ0353520.1 low specificity L-threonine aldolase [Pseudarthrobacter sp. PH31-O2]WGZ81330.1 low specificity L-threonine aldolase [Arthrobacter sp. EM1]